MKKKTLVSTISLLSALIAAQTVYAQDVPKVYGKLSLAQEFSDTGVSGEKTEKLNSNASRIGVKGEVVINENLTAIYQAEFGVDADAKGDKDGHSLTRRNTFAGFKTEAGTLTAGNFDTPLKMIQNKVDLFNDFQGDISKMLVNGEIRAENIVQYSTPSLAGFNVNVAHINSEKNDNTAKNNNGVSTSLTYNLNDLYVAAAYDTDVKVGMDTLRVVGQYKLGAVQLGALWESEDNGDESKEGWMTSVYFKANSEIALKAQYGASDIKKEDGTSMSLGVDYSLSKQAKTFAYYTSEEYKDSETASYAGIGFEYNF